MPIRTGTSIKQFAEKEYFRHSVLNNLRNGPWTALTAYGNFSPEKHRFIIKIIKKSFN